MKINQLVEVTGNVTTIIQLAEGDAYKRLITSNYESDKIVVGVVTNVYSNGDTTAISTLEYQDGYFVEVKPQVFSGDKDVQIFPITSDEVQARVADLITTSRQRVQDAEAELRKKQLVVEQLEALAQKSITEAATAAAAV